MGRFSKPFALIISMGLLSVALPAATHAEPGPCNFSAGISTSDDISLRTFVGMYRTPQNYQYLDYCNPTRGVIPPTGWTIDDLINTFGANPDDRLNVTPRAVSTPTPAPSLAPKPQSTSAATPNLSPTPKATATATPIQTAAPTPSPAAKVLGTQTQAPNTQAAKDKRSSPNPLIITPIVVIAALGICLGWLIWRKSRRA